MNGSPETPLRAFIVDDERLARENLRDLLREHPRIRVVGEARNIDEARRGIDERRPDLLFLDIQMPGGSGFDLIEGLEAPPLTIFVTAYDRFAIRAFEVNALDYLLKPVDPARLKNALERALERSLPAPEPETDLSPTDRVFLNTGKKALFLPVTDIAAITAEGNYTHVIDIRGRRYMVRCTLKTWENRLPKEIFIPLDRSLMINRQQVRSWSVQCRKADVRLADIDTPFSLGRAAYQRFRELVMGRPADLKS